MVIRSIFIRAMCATVLLAATANVSTAQTAPSASNKPAHMSDGLLFAINSVRMNANNGTLFIQYAVQNTTKVRKYLILYGSGIMATDNGLIATVENQDITGINHCFMNNGRDDVSLQYCTNAHDTTNTNGGGTNIENYSYIEPGEIAQASITYGFYDRSTIRQASTASFKFMALVCSATGDHDALSDPSKSVTQPKILNVNFPFVPIQH